MTAHRLDRLAAPARAVDATAASAVAAIGCLTVMISITAVTGISQETFEIFRPPAVYAADLAAHATAVRWLFAIDTAFLVLYTAVFIGFAQRIATSMTRPWLRIALGALIAAAVLDMVEDHHCLAMLSAVEFGGMPSGAEIAVQHTLSQLKFNLSYLGTFLLGVAVPRHTRAGRALALLLTVGTLIQSVALWVAPIAALPAGNVGRWIGYLVGFGLTLAVLRAQSAGAAATDAPA